MIISYTYDVYLAVSALRADFQGSPVLPRCSGCCLPVFSGWTSLTWAHRRGCDLAWGQRSGFLERMKPEGPMPPQRSLCRPACHQGPRPRPVALADRPARTSEITNILPSSHSNKPPWPPWSGTLTPCWPGFELVTWRWVTSYLITNSLQPQLLPTSHEPEAWVRTGAEGQPGAPDPSVHPTPAPAIWPPASLRPPPGLQPSLTRQALEEAKVTVGRPPQMDAAWHRSCGPAWPGMSRGHVGQMRAGPPPVRPWL